MKLIRKIHTYLGLLTVTSLLVYAIAGLASVSSTPPADRKRPDPATRRFDFKAPPDSTDRQTADLIWERAQIPLTGKPAQFTIRRDARQNLTMQFFSPNGLYRIVYLEGEGQVTVEHSRNRLAQYFSNLHESTSRGSHPDLRVWLWQWYNEFAMWSLGLMVVMGVYLWLATRPGFRWAQASFVAGAGGFALLYFLVR